MKQIVVFLIYLCLVSSLFSFEKKELFEGFEKSSIRVNGVHMPPSIHDINEHEAYEVLSEYFLDHPYNRELRVNLNYYCFTWADNHKALQKGLSQAILSQILLLRKMNNKTLEKTLNQDDERLKHYLSLLAFFSDLGKYKCLLSSQELENIENELVKFAKKHKLFGRTIDPEQQRISAFLSLQTALSLRSISQLTGNQSSLIKVLKLKGWRLEILEQRNILVLDNGALPDRNFVSMDLFLKQLPDHLHYARTMSVLSAYGTRKQKKISLRFLNCAGNWFNVFDIPVDKSRRNQFPKEANPVVNDQFMSVFIHELNHGVDSVYIRNQPKLEAYRKQLIEEAGTDSKNYLRSMFADGFFVKLPQEFFASMGNMYFASSLQTMNWALLQPKPIQKHLLRQFLLMATVYREGNEILFYESKPEGKYQITRIPAQFDGIYPISIEIEGETISFRWLFMD